jgi:hypothetical protein
VVRESGARRQREHASHRQKFHHTTSYIFFITRY